MKIKEKAEKVKNFVITHKGLIIGSIALVGTGIAVLAIRKHIFIAKTAKTLVENAGRIKDLPKPELNIGNLAEYWLEDDGAMAIINNVPLKEMGRFGEELLKLSNDKIKITPETTMEIIGGLYN